jgi:flavin reductase (DIM6/NTAB) family NADH-FMN oxidoreductase RutF
MAAFRGFRFRLGNRSVRTGMTEPAKTVDIGSFWRAIGVRAIGPAVVTAKDATGPAGFLALSTAHLTASPPTMMVSIGLKTSALSVITSSRAFAINFLAKGDEGLADMFGGKGDVKGADRFAPGKWTELTTGAPVLLDAVGVLDCELEEMIERHGTMIAIGKLVNFTSKAGAAPLVSFGGKYL